jgi:hypothetical protein
VCGVHSGKTLFSSYVFYFFCNSSSFSTHFSSFHHFQPFNNSSILHISPFYCLPSFLSSKKLPSLPFWVTLIDFFIPKNSLLICENITDFFFGTFYALELRFIWRGHINLYLLGFAFTLRCVFF